MKNYNIKFLHIFLSLTMILMMMNSCKEDDDLLISSPGDAYVKINLQGADFLFDGTVHSSNKSISSSRSLGTTTHNNLLSSAIVPIAGVIFYDLFVFEKASNNLVSYHQIVHGNESQLILNLQAGKEYVFIALSDFASPESIGGLRRTYNYVFNDPVNKKLEQVFYDGLNYHVGNQVVKVDFGSFTSLYYDRIDNLGTLQNGASYDLDIVFNRANSLINLFIDDDALELPEGEEVVLKEAYFEGAHVVYGESLRFDISSGYIDLNSFDYDENFSKTNKFNHSSTPNQYSSSLWTVAPTALAKLHMTFTIGENEIKVVREDLHFEKGVDYNITLKLKPGSSGSFNPQIQHNVIQEVSPKTYNWL